MDQFTVVMVRSPGISEEECRRRLHQAYTLLLDTARRKTTADRDEFGDQTRTAAGDARSDETEAPEKG
jgi:hypothetical protein